jgi:predicted metal-binding protein
MENKDYIVIVQCDIVMQRCSGYFCEQAFFHRRGGFARYGKEKDIRTVYFSCGGCCGRAVHRKLNNLISCLKRKEEIKRENVVVHLSSCITKDNFHGPRCPHLDYLKIMIEDKLKVDLVEGTNVSKTSEKLREKGVYKK